MANPIEQNSRFQDPQSGNTTGAAAAVAALFHDPEDAERAIERLSQAGVPKSNIGVAVDSRRDEGKEGKGVGFIKKLEAMFKPEEREEYDSSNAGDVLENMGLNGEQVNYYRSALHEGDVLLTVYGPYAQQARQAMQDSNAVFPDKLDTRRDFGAAGGSTDRARMSNANTAAASGATESSDARDSNREGEGNQRIQLLGEVLRVHKERIRSGEVRIRKEIVTEQKTIQVPVTREELVIERHAASGEQPAGTAQLGSEREIRIPLEGERVTLDKQPVVREEVEVGKRQVQEVRSVSGDVRHEELQVDDESKTGVDDWDVNDPRRRKSA